MMLTPMLVMGFEKLSRLRGRGARWESTDAPSMIDPTDTRGIMVLCGAVKGGR